MTKLEEKLLELGYERVHLEFAKGSIYCFNASIYNKIGKYALFVIKILENEIYDYHLHKNIHNQQDLDNLQQAFNEMQKDLEVLNNVKD